MEKLFSVLVLVFGPELAQQCVGKRTKTTNEQYERLRSFGAAGVRCQTTLVESLILAQDQRWRRA